MDKTTRQLWQLNKYTWMSLAFVLMYLPVARAQGLFVAPDWAAWTLFVLAVADGLSRSLLAWRHGGPLEGRLAVAYNWLDMILVAGGIALTGGIASDLWLLYFVVLIFESLYATRPSQRWLTFCVALVYLLATLPIARYVIHAPAPAVFMRLYVSRVTFLILVSALARRISANAMEQSRELLLLREQMATGEERARIAREVHDGLGHALVSIILRLELCARLIKKEPDEAAALLKEEIPALRAAWSEGRDLAFHLRPWEREASAETLPDLLRRHGERFAARTGLTITVNTEGMDTGGAARPLSPQMVFGLTRIVQEALTNAAKHAHATHLDVSLTMLPHNTLQCVIHDDGVGFDTTLKEHRAAGMGLTVMRERAEALGGTLTLESTPGRGTTLVVHLPV